MTGHMYAGGVQRVTLSCDSALLSRPFLQGMVQRNGCLQAGYVLQVDLQRNARGWRHPTEHYTLYDSPAVVPPSTESFCERCSET